MHPAKAVGRNEMPFGRDARVDSINIVLDGPLSPQGRADLGSEPPSLQQCHILPNYFGPCLLLVG